MGDNCRTVHIGNGYCECDYIHHSSLGSLMQRIRGARMIGIYLSNEWRREACRFVTP
jgi:hypothetical protein